MSRLGAIKMRERRWQNADWIYSPPLSFEEKQVFEECTEEQAKIGCGLALFFMKLNPPETWWFQYCVEQSCLYPDRSYRHMFWWSLRTYGAEDKENFETWQSYFNWKISQTKDMIW